MQARDQSRAVVSNTFFVFLLAAISIYGIAVAFDNLAADDLLLTLIVVAAVIAINPLVVGLRLPSPCRRRSARRRVLPHPEWGRSYPGDSGSSSSCRRR